MLSRGDLIRCLGSSAKNFENPEQRRFAELCGLSPKTEKKGLQIGTGGGTVEVDENIPAPVVDPEPPKPRASTEVPRMKFWLATTVEIEPKDQVDARRQPPERYSAQHSRTEADLALPGKPQKGKPLLPWSKLWPFLHHALGVGRPSREPDIPRIISLMARGHPIRTILRRTKKRWNPLATIYIDRRLAMAPFWDDYDFLVKRLQKLRGRAGLRIMTIESEGKTFYEREVTKNGLGIQRRLKLPDFSSSVLVLGDLGQFVEGGESVSYWRALGLRLRRCGLQPWALTPCPPSRWRQELRGCWNLAYWDRGKRLPSSGNGQRAYGGFDSDAADSRRDRLRDLLAPAVRIERGLLRDIRTLRPNSELDAASEYDLWNSDLATGSVIGISLKAEALTASCGRLRNQPVEQLAETLTLIRYHHRYSDSLFGAIELMLLKDYLLPEQWSVLEEIGQVSDQGLQEAEDFYANMVATIMDSDAAADLKDGIRRWTGRDLDRLEHQQLASEEWQLLWALGRKKNDVEIPPFVEKEVIEWTQDWDEEESAHRIGLQNGGIVSFRTEEGFPLLRLSSRGKEAWVTASDRAQAVRRSYRFSDARPVTFPTETHQAAFHSDRECYYIQPIDQPEWAERMGYDRFGLYADLVVNDVEFRLRWIPPGRFFMGEEKEGSEVAIEEGFWMAATQTTQALWLALQPKKWLGRQKNPSRFKGDVALPVEKVSWKDCQEFCRTLQELVPGLAFDLPSEAQWEYACRAGTRSVFHNGSDDESAMADLGWFSGNSEEKTHPVAEKKSNAWGLHDMHGNVWEWCLDEIEGPAKRVVRGGSWVNSARYCRSAFRFAFPPGFRFEDLGFRLVAGQRRAQEPEAGKSGAVGLWSEGAVAPRPRDEASDSRLTSGASVRPGWATEFDGRRAAFGLGEAMFRFRWIPPGRFVMGSPEDEEGRQDREGPQHEVQITRGFWMLETPVTCAMWLAIESKNPRGFEGLNRPVENVNWKDCRLFIDQLNQRIPQLRATFPTEAQWEYACRAGTTGAFNAESKEPALDALGWYSENSGGSSHEVAQKRSNAWGLYDMHGNVDEWCLDGQRNYTVESKVDPVGPQEDSALRVVRGGSWSLSARGCRSASRFAPRPGLRGGSLGFRLVAGQEQKV